MCLAPALDSINLLRPRVVMAPSWRMEPVLLADLLAGRPAGAFPAI